MMICPICGQGEILKLKFRALPEILWFCSECDATWLRGDDIGKVPFVDFGDYMASKGVAPPWGEFETLPPD